MKKTFATLILFKLIVVNVLAHEEIKIGALFDENDVDAQNVFDITITRQNADNNNFRLKPIIKYLISADPFEAQSAVCDMVESGAVAIFGPKSIYLSDLVASICNELNIPHIVSYQRISQLRINYHLFTRNIYPDTNTLSGALVDVIRKYEWKRFAIIYENDESLARLNGILQLFTSGYKAVTVYKYTDKSMIKSVLKRISKSLENRVIVDCSIECIAEIIKQGININMMNEYMSYFITMPDGHVVDTPELSEVRSNITAIRLMADENVEAAAIAEQWKKKKQYMNWQQKRNAEQVSTDKLKIEPALIRDSVALLTTALQFNELYQRISEPAIRCDYLAPPRKVIQQWPDGRELLKNIDRTNASGITGPLGFDGFIRDGKERTRNHFHVDFVELDIYQKKNKRKRSFNKVAEWKSLPGLIITRSFEELKSQKAQIIQNKVFNVISRIGMPYLRKIENGTVLIGNDRYEGFVKDLIDDIARVAQFEYNLILVSDNELGNYDPVTDKWNGMIGKVLNGKADLAICDFTITYERKTVLDFSIPFMNLGISILYTKPRKEKAELLSFLNPLHESVWMYTSTAFLCVSLTIFFLAKGIPTRLTTVVWWFFAMIMLSSYTANLAAFLTKEQIIDNIDSVEELAAQSKVKYGLLRGGSTEKFFKESNVSTYQKMWAVMEHTDPSVFVKSNDDGVTRVKQSNHLYAFLMESETIHYTTHIECDLTRVGENLDSKAYGIGMPMNSPYRDVINRAILLLKEGRNVSELKTKWWKDKNIKVVDGLNVSCIDNEHHNGDNTALDFAHVRGVLLVLLIGFGLSMLIGIFEFMWNVRKIAVSQMITPKEAFKNELRFACKFWINRKPVLDSRESQSGSNTSSEK